MDANHMVEHGAAHGSATLARAGLAWGLMSLTVAGVVVTHAVHPDRIGDPALAVVGALLVAMGLGLNGMALHDLLDQRRSRGRIDHPLTVGKLGSAQGALVASGGLVMAMLGGGLLGRDAMLIVAALATGVLLYNAMARFIPALGVVLIGLLVAGTTLLGGWPPAAAWMPWMVLAATMSVVLVIYIASGQRPAMRPKVAVGLALECVVVSCVLGVIPMTAPQHDVALWWPIGTIVLLAVLLALRARPVVRGTQLVRTVGLWGGLHAAAWCMAVGAMWWAVTIAAATVVVGAAIMALRDLRPKAAASDQWL